MRFALASTLSLLVALPRTPAAAQAPGLAACGAPPVVAVTSVATTPGSCGAEFTCIRVDWTANVNPAGLTLTGFRVELKVVVKGQEQRKTVTVPPSARTTNIGVFGVAGFQTYDAKVMADYSSCASGSRSGSF